MPLAIIVFCCWYCRRTKNGPSPASRVTSPRNRGSTRHNRFEDDEAAGRTHTLDLDEPNVEFSVQRLDDGTKARKDRSYGEEGMEEVKLDGDEEQDYGTEEARPKKKKVKKATKKGGKLKKKKMVEEEDELELGGI